MKTKGFTLVEIMIVVALIGILGAIAVPNYLISRKKSLMNSCIANLKEIEGAKLQVSFAHTNMSDLNVLFGASAYIKVTPVCPLSKLEYIVGEMNEPPVCPNPTTHADYPHVLSSATP
jgi:prepilin-type N-terminal cleavage/methylation domain-containing protein